MERGSDGDKRIEGGVEGSSLDEVMAREDLLLIEGGRFEQVRAHRQAFQDQVEPLFRNVVEQATGRTVRVFLSQVSEEGVAAEVFVLEGKAEESGNG